jgi:hypothetical protein
MKKQPLGKLPADAYGMLELPVAAADILDGFRSAGFDRHVLGRRGRARYCRRHSREALERARRIVVNELTRTAQIDSGAPVAKLLPSQKK